MNRRKKRKRKARRAKICPKITKNPVHKKRSATQNDLENNSSFDFNLVFKPKSKLYPKRQTEMEKFIEALTPLPKGYRPPIASGAKREKQSWRNVKGLLANIYEMRKKGKTSIAVSLSPNSYAGQSVTSGIINLFKLAEEFGFIELWPGYFDKKNRYNSKLARIVPLPKIFKLLAKKAKTKKVSPDTNIELRQTVPGKKKKITIPKKQWQKKLTRDEYEAIFTLNSKIDYFNLVLSDHKKSYTGKDGKKHKFKAKFKAIFTDNFKQGGRLYVKGKKNYQQQPKEIRKTICFNGHPTKELDFSGLHIRILYHSEGRSYSFKKDPYAEVLLKMGKDPENIKQEFGTKFYKQIRNDLKVMLLALINGKFEAKNPIRAAAKRANFRLFKDHRSQSLFNHDCRECKKRWKKAELLNRNGSCFEVIKAFYEAHKPIKKYFSSGRGLKLQNVDAEIACAVMLEMMIPNRSIPVLPVHDSFITFDKPTYLAKLRKAMKLAYRIVMQQRTGSKKQFRIPIK